MTSDCLLAYLADHAPTETVLEELAHMEHFAVTWLADPLDSLDAIGWALIPCDDGLLRIPYIAVTLGDGWEQLDGDHAVLQPLPPDFAARAAALQTAEQVLIEAVLSTESLEY